MPTTPHTPHTTMDTGTTDTDVPGLHDLITRDLAPLVVAIDLEGHYPEAFLRALGRQGGLAGGIDPQFGGTGTGIRGILATMAQIGEACLSTAFVHWCHTACTRYIQLSDNETARQRWLPQLAQGTQLAGTGLSNTFKSLGEIERPLLRAQRVDGGYEINGTLPWVSNLGDDHIFVTGCPVEGDGRMVFFITRCDQAGFRLIDSAHFTALEGTRTFACQFRQAMIADAEVLAHPDQSAAYQLRIQPGMFLAQLGMAIGLVRECIRLIESAGITHAHINAYEQDQAADIHTALQEMERETFRLAERLDQQPGPDDLPDLITAAMRVRLVGGELALRAAQAAMLHQGARGYLRTARAQRRLREAYFLAIVTPALKHLRRELARREAPAPA